jgi:aconitate decarboxylase
MTQPTNGGDRAQLTRGLASFAANLQFDDLPPTLVERIKLHILDGIGVCLHGAALPWTQRLRAFVLAEGGAAVAGLWGTGERTSVTQAVLVNSTAGHAFEMDDIHKESVLHPNSLAVPVVLALADAHPTASGRDLLTAIVAGYEVGTRVGNAATTALFLNGFHPQGTSGTFVAAAAAGRLLGLDTDAMQHALGIAGSLGAGLMAAQEGAMVKRLHAGRAAQSGVTAAMLASRGFTGIHDILDVDYGGFLSSFARDYRLTRLTDGLGEDWEAAKVGFKMYPNVTSIHTALDALKSIMTDERLTARDIASIEVGCGHMTYVHTAWDYQPNGVTAAQMNLFYGLAVMALHGDVNVTHYEEHLIADPEILAFLPRIRAYEDPELEAMGPAYRHGCRLTVRSPADKSWTREILARRGSPEHNVNADDIARKFKANVAARCIPRDAKRIADLVAAFDTLANPLELSTLLAARAVTAC